jgi:hypothetical protein
MNPTTERTPLSWILKNREKQEKGSYLYFLFLSVFLTRSTSAAPQIRPSGVIIPQKSAAGMRNVGMAE